MKGAIVGKGITCWAFLLSVVFAGACIADTVTMTSGRTVEGVVLREDPSSVSVALNYGTVTFPRAAVQKIERSNKPAAAPAAKTVGAPASAKPRVPSWLTAVKVLTAQPWATEFHQIPATVVDTGVMKNVPYQSFRCGVDYEVNVYGDPDAPAGIEIGVYHGLLKDKAARENCVGFIAAVLCDPTDAAMLKLLDRRQDLVVHKGLSIEITSGTRTARVRRDHGDAGVPLVSSWRANPSRCQNVSRLTVKFTRCNWE